MGKARRQGNAAVTVLLLTVTAVAVVFAMHQLHSANLLRKKLAVSTATPAYGRETASASANSSLPRVRVVEKRIEVPAPIDEAAVVAWLTTRRHELSTQAGRHIDRVILPEGVYLDSLPESPLAASEAAASAFRHTEHDLPDEVRDETEKELTNPAMDLAQIEAWLRAKKDASNQEAPKPADRVSVVSGTFQLRGSDSTQVLARVHNGASKPARELKFVFAAKYESAHLGSSTVDITLATPLNPGETRDIEVTVPTPNVGSAILQIQQGLKSFEARVNGSRFCPLEWDLETELQNSLLRWPVLENYFRNKAARESIWGWAYANFGDASIDDATIDQASQNPNLP